MLVQINQEVYSDFYLAIESKYWENDQKHLDFIHKLNTRKSFIPSGIKGIYVSNLNPKLSFSELDSVDQFPQFLYTNSKVDKRNRKIKKILSHPASNWYSYTFEELSKMSEQECNLARKYIKNKYHFFNSYGVVDSLEQFYSYFKFLDFLDQKYVAFLTPIQKKNQPSDGGWRWHKWGQYIGKHKPQHEYLYDEKDIDLVYVYTIMEVKDSLTPTISNDLLDLYITKNSCYIYTKDKQYIYHLRYHSKVNMSVLGRGDFGFDKDKNPIKKYQGTLEENKEVILQDLTLMYSQFILDKSLPSF